MYASVELMSTIHLGPYTIHIVFTFSTLVTLFITIVTVMTTLRWRLGGVGVSLRQPLCTEA